MLTKKDVKVLEEMQNRADVKGKGLIDKFVWLNTATPEYEVGDIVKVTNRSMHICDERVIDWNGVVCEVKANVTEKFFVYMVEVEYENRGIKKTTTVCGLADNLKPSGNVHSGKVFNKPLDHEEALDLYW